MRTLTRRDMLILLAGTGVALTGCEDNFNLFSLVGPPAETEALSGGSF